MSGISEPLTDYETDEGFDPDDGPVFGQYGCIHCGYQAWSHTCCDDLCRNCNEPEDCESGGRPCEHCNPDGDYRP